MSKRSSDWFLSSMISVIFGVMVIVAMIVLG
jgi:hypothetical protein